jgi:hypothetical protein
MQRLLLACTGVSLMRTARPATRPARHWPTNFDPRSFNWGVSESLCAAEATGDRRPRTPAVVTS